MKKGGVREINSFISVSNTPNTIDRRKVSALKVTAAKSDASKVERRVSIKSPAVKDGTPRPVLANKKPVFDAPRKSIVAGSSSSAAVKSEKSAQQSRIKLQDVKPDRNAQLLRSNSIREQNDRLMTRRVSQSNPSDVLLKKSTLEVAPRKPSIPLKAAKLEYAARKNSVSSIPKVETVKPNTIVSAPVEKANIDEDYEYEDDFEDYESDFESLSESQNSSSDDDVQANTKVLVEEEKKMDSGSYDLTYLHQLQKQKKQLEVIREALNKENTIAQQSANSVMTQNTKFDSKDAFKGSENTNILLDFNTRSMENFASAKKRQQNSKVAHKIASRGEKLLQMITLDSMNFSLFEMAPVPYHIFMRSYARKNTTQAFTQTNEDNISCEIQTDNIFYQTKWTQHPVIITKQMLDEERNLSEIFAGVGEEGCDFEKKDFSTLNINTTKLINFMKLVGEEVISLLEEELFKIELTEETYVSKNTEISECVSCLKMDSISFLLKRPISFLLYDPCNNARILTVHGLETNENENDRYSYLCIWNIHQFWKPKFILKSHNRVTSCCFSGFDSSFVVAGHEDGSICVWNLRENVIYSEKISVNNTNISIRYPSFNTAETRTENPTHRNKVISVECSKLNNVDLRNMDEMRFEKVFSIDENNILIAWSLSPGSKTKMTPWCRINFFTDQILDISQKLPKTSFQSTCLKIVSENKILIGNDVGAIVECNLYVKKFRIHQKYSTRSNPEQSRITCLEICPYNHQYFVAGYSNGNIDLFNSSYTEPISSIENYSPFSSAINSVQWLWTKLDHVLVLDFNFLFSIYRFQPDNYSLIRRCKTEGVYAVKVSSSDPRLQLNNLYFAVLAGNEIQVHKLKPSEDSTK